MIGEGQQRIAAAEQRFANNYAAALAASSPGRIRRSMVIRQESGTIGVTLWLLRRGLGNLSTRPDER